MSRRQVCGFTAGIFELVEGAREKVVLRFDPDELFWLCESGVGRFQVQARAVLIVGALDEDFRRGAGFQIVRGARAHRKSGGEKEGRITQLATQLRNRARAERETRQCKSEVGIPRSQPGQSRVGIFHSARQMRVFTLARAHAPKIEAQHHQTSAPQPARDAKDDFIVHCAAIKRMRMADDGGQARFCVFRFFQQRFQTAGRAGDELRLDAAGHFSGRWNRLPHFRMYGNW